MLSYLVGFFLATLSFFYLIASEFPTIALLNFYPYAFLFSLFVSLLTLFFLKKSDKFYLQDLTYSSKYISIFLFCIVALFHILTKTNLRSFDADEYFRLSFARYIDNYGLPVSSEHFVASHSTQMYYYSFLEFISVCIHKILFGKMRLEVIYFYVVPFLKDILIIFVSYNLIDSSLKLLGSANRVFCGALRIFIPLFLIFPPIPFVQAIVHSFYRQEGLASFIILLVVSLLAEHLSSLILNLNKFRIFIPFLLGWTMLSVLMVTKIPYMPVMFCGLLVFSIVSAFYRKKYFLYYTMVSLFGILFFLTTKSVYPSFSQIDTKVRFSLFELVQENGYGQYFPWASNLFFSVFAAFGGMWLWLVFICTSILLRAKKIEFLFLYSFVLVLCLAGYFAVLFFRMSQDTGGAEAYWSISSWYSTAILVSLSGVVLASADEKFFPKKSLFSQKKYISGAIFLSFCGWIANCFILTGHTFMFVIPNTIPAHVLYTCRAISEFREKNLKWNSKSNTCAIVNPYPNEADSLSLNAFCDCGTVVSVNSLGGVGSMIAQEPMYSNALKINRLLLNVPNPVALAQKYLADSGLNELYIFKRQDTFADPELEKYKIIENNGSYTAIYRIIRQ